MGSSPKLQYGDFYGRCLEVKTYRVSLHDKALCRAGQSKGIGGRGGLIVQLASCYGEEVRGRDSAQYIAGSVSANEGA